MMKRLYYQLAAAFLGALSALVPLHAKDAGTTHRIESFYSLPHLVGTAPSAPNWRDDGRTFAFLWNDEGYDFRDIWLYDLDSTSLKRMTTLAGPARRQEGAPGVTEFIWLPGDNFVYALDDDLYLHKKVGTVHQLTDTAVAENQLAASVNGTSLTFLRDGELWLKNIDDEVEKRLFKKHFERQYIESYAWSPMATHIAIILADDSNVPFREVPYYADGKNRINALTRAFPGDQTTRRRVGIIDVNSGEIRWLEHPAEHPIYSMAWSASGHSLMTDSTDYFLVDRNIRTYDTNTGKATVFYSEREPRQVEPAWSTAWAPDDKGLIILSDHSGWYHLYHKKSRRSKAKALTSGEWEVASFEVDTVNKAIYFRANRSHPGERQLYRVALSGGDVEQVGGLPGTHNPTFSPDFRHAADIISNDSTPADLYLSTLQDKGKEKRLTTSQRSEFANYVWAKTRYLHFPAHTDGTELVARVTLPHNFNSGKRYPMIVGSIYSDTVNQEWNSSERPAWGLDQFLASRGYIVMKVNVAGSWGQGKLLRQRLVTGLYGNIDIDDLESAVRFMVAEGYADPERVGIWGSSYGGLMTLMSLFKKPGLYAAGIAGAPASNVWHAFPEQMWTLGNTVHDNFEKYQRQAAQHHTSGLEDPLMIIHGNADVVVLYGDTLDLSSRLIRDGKLFELVTLPGASHGWKGDNLAQTRFAYNKMIDFFDRYLKPVE